MNGHTNKNEKEIKKSKSLWGSKVNAPLSNNLVSENCILTFPKAFRRKISLKLKEISLVSNWGGGH